MSRNLPSVDLDAIDPTIATVTLFGRTVEVKALDGFAYEVYTQLTDPAAKVNLAEVWDAAARVLPSLTSDEVRRLRLPQLGALLALAAGRVKAVEDRYPNSDGPTTETATTKTPDSPPASSPTTPSDSSAPASPAPTG